MVLRSGQGEIVSGRCRATNLCLYCARLAAVENAELLSLDAMAGVAPGVYAVLTTASTDRDPRRFYRAREQVGKALRRRWPGCEWAVQVEFTTGQAGTSGGYRRQHWNWLLKGIPDDDVDLARGVMTRVWCPRVDGIAAAQYVALVGELGGLMRYLALHFAKPAQAPPIGWRGHRFLHSRGYFPAAMPEMREAARTSLRYKREVWRAEQRGAGVHDAELQAREAMALAEQTSWTFARLAQPIAMAEEAAAVRARRALEIAERDRLDHDLVDVDRALAEETYFLGELRRHRETVRRL